FHDIELKLNMSKLLQKHLAVVAQSGAGKSFLMSVILEELQKRSDDQGKIAVVVFDTHGEYSSFGEPNTNSDYKDFSSTTRIINGSEIKIATKNISPQMISSLVPSITTVQKREFFRVISELKNEMKSGLGPFDLNNLKGEISGLDSKIAFPLNNIIDELFFLNIFGKIDDPSIIDFVKPGQLSIIDLNNIISDRKKQLIVAYISQKLFNLRRVKKICPFAVLVEEAHNFIPETTSVDHALAKPILRTIAREGRKFGASLIVVSQRPKRLDTTTLANCNTNIILRITNPYDLDHIKQSSEGLDNNSVSMISSLRVGEALIVGEAVSAPTFFKVRMRESAPSKHEMSLEEAAKRFYSDEKKQDDEVNTFL
ncbi:MAG: ATP-binding protein, partial [Candidatus ainarchaeum sp.]|nr:ATP-binding protein [Candidatus ainarchaeum sp.]